MVDDVEQRILEHQLRRRGLVEAFRRARGLAVGVHLQHGVRVPHGFERDRRPQDRGQRRGIGFGLQAPRPVRQGAVQLHFPVRGEVKYLPQASIIRICRSLAVAPGDGSHEPAFAAENRPTALRGADHAVKAAQGLEDVPVAIEQFQRASAGEIDRDGAIVAEAVDHGDQDRLGRYREGGHGEREVGVIAVVAHADHRHRARQPQLTAQPARRAEGVSDVRGVHGAELGRIQQDAARRKFRADRAEQRRGQPHIIPARHAGVNVPRTNPQLRRRFHQAVQAVLWIVGAVLDAGVTLLLVVADQLDPALGGDFQQRHAAVVPSGADAEQISGLPALELVRQRCGAFAGVSAGRRQEGSAGGVGGQDRITDGGGKATEDVMGGANSTEGPRHSILFFSTPDQTLRDEADHVGGADIALGAFRHCGLNWITALRGHYGDMTRIAQIVWPARYFRQWRVHELLR